ncbi:MAG: hypothetical protein AAFO94_15490 [Bacteroidota bacterium]
MDNEKDIQRIEDYLHNRMEASVKRAFEEQLKSDKQFAQRFENHQLAHKALDFMIAGNLKSQLEDMEQQYYGEAASDNDARVVPMPAGNRGRRFLLMRVAAAAVVILAVGLSYIYFPMGGPSGSELAASYYEAPTYQIRGQENSTIDALSLGLTALGTGDYETAIRELSSIPTNDAYYIQAQYFKGHALYQSRSFEQAESTFLAVSKQNDMRYQQEAQWYALLSCLAQDKDCLLLTESVAQTAGHAYEKEAKTILDELK